MRKKRKKDILKKVNVNFVTHNCRFIRFLSFALEEEKLYGPQRKNEGEIYIYIFFFHFFSRSWSIAKTCNINLRFFKFLRLST